MGGGGRILPWNRLMGMYLYHWMGSHFHEWINYHGVEFSIELVEWDCTFFGGIWGKKILACRDLKNRKIWRRGGETHCKSKVTSHKSDP